MDVSVVVPTRNRSALLARTLGSVLRQQNVAFEAIVIDEASTDDTPSLLASFDDPRLRVIRHDSPRGLPAARNRGAEEARGEWFSFIDDDDLWAPEKLARQLDAARQAGRDWAYAGSVNFENGRIVHSRPPVPPDEAVAVLPRYNPIPGGGSNIIVRRSMWLHVGPFDTRFQGGEDWELSIRLAKHSPPAWVCSPLIAKRVHSTNMFLDVAEIVRAVRLTEAIHNTTADWGRLHRWLAQRYLRNGQRSAALGQFARAAVKGQLPGVLADLTAILRRRLGYARKTDRGAPFVRDPWAASAAAWLSEFEGDIQY